MKRIIALLLSGFVVSLAFGQAGRVKQLENKNRVFSSLAAIQKAKVGLGEVIYLSSLDAFYRIENAPVSGYPIDTMAVIPVNGGGAYAVVKASDQNRYKAEWFGAIGDGISDDQIAIQNGDTFTRLRRAALEFDHTKTYVGVMPIRGAMTAANQKYVWKVDSYSTWVSNSVNPNQRAKIYPKPPPNFILPNATSNSGLDGNAILIDNFTGGAVDSIYFEGLHFWVPKDTMVLFDKTLNNIPNVFYDYDAPASPTAKDWHFKNCSFENFSNVQISNQSAEVHNILYEGCRMMDIGGWHTGFSGSASAPGTRALQDQFVWINPIEADTFFVNAYGPIHPSQSVAYWLKDNKIVERAALGDYNYNSEFLSDLLSSSNDTLFLKNKFSDVDSIVIWSQSTTTKPGPVWYYVERADLGFSPSKNVTSRNNEWWGGMNDQADHWEYYSRSVDQLTLDGNYYNMQQSAPGVWDLSIRDGGGSHIKGGNYRDVEVTSCTYENSGVDAILGGNIINGIFSNNIFRYNKAAPVSPSGALDFASVHGTIDIVGNEFVNETLYPLQAILGGSDNIPTGANANINVIGGSITGFTTAFSLQYSNWFIRGVTIVSPDSSMTRIVGENQNGRQDRKIEITNVTIDQKTRTYLDGNTSGDLHMISGADHVVIDNLQETGNPGTELRIQRGKDILITHTDLGLINLGYDPGTLPTGGDIIVKDNKRATVVFGQAGNRQDSVRLLSNYAQINDNLSTTAFEVNSPSFGMTLHDTRKVISISASTTGRAITTINVRTLESSGKLVYTLRNDGANAIDLAQGGNINLSGGNRYTIESGQKIDLVYDVATNTNDFYGPFSPDDGLLRLKEAFDLGISNGKFLQAEGSTPNVYTNILGITGSNNLTLSNAFGNLVFQTGSQNRLWISSTGSVGIGTISPNHKLDVAGDMNVTGDYLGINNPRGGENTLQATVDSLALTFTLFHAIPYTPTDSIAVDTALNSFPITARINGDTLRQITYSVTQAPNIDLDLRVLIWDGTNYTPAYAGTIPAGQRSVTVTGAVVVAIDQRIFPEILTDSGASGLDLEFKFQKP